MKKKICLILYYSIARFLPDSTSKFGGKFYKYIRYILCKNIFQQCGKNVNIERKAKFGNGSNICIDDNSGIGINCIVPNNIIIGKNVMMGPNCYILADNHVYDDISRPMNQQGMTKPGQTIIDDDVWIGRNVMITTNRHISKGSIIAMGCVLTKDFPEYSIIGGNPSKFIKSRKDNVLNKDNESM